MEPHLNTEGTERTTPGSRRVPIEPDGQRCLIGLTGTVLILWSGWLFANWIQGIPSIDRTEAAPLPYQLIVPVNQAGVPELCLLPRIGPTLADRIIASRQADGPFRSTEDLQRVKGIGPITARRLEPWVAFD